MNYYIQGDAAKADKIKAAFEKLGYEPYCWTFETEFYFTVDGTKTVQIISSSSKRINIIKTHPDYKELELPIEFKDGDIIGFNDCTHNDGSYIDWVGIYKGKADAEKSHFFHCVATGKNTFRIGGSWRVFTAYPATKEQRDILFRKMKEAGYQWDADKKELRKIQPHYDIANFYAGMPVLVRDDESNDWRYVQFSHTRIMPSFRFVAGAVAWQQCIPFEGNEHLLGTSDPCDEQYINW